MTAASSDAPSVSPSSSSSSALISPDARFKIAATGCEVKDSMQDRGASFHFDTKGSEDTSGDSFADVGCTLGWLDIPDYVLDHIESTRALDGMQEDEGDGIKARWTYHPDDGLDLTLIDTDLIAERS